jgi:hypothetical protein
MGILSVMWLLIAEYLLAVVLTGERKTIRAFLTKRDAVAGPVYFMAWWLRLECLYLPGGPGRG